MVWRLFCFKLAISSGRYAHFCFKGFVLCQWCQIDDSKSSKFRWLDLLGWVCLVDIGCHGGWPTTAHQSTTDDQQQPTNNPPKSGHMSDTSSHDVFVSLLCPLFGVLVDIGCHGGWPTTAHQSTTDNQQQPTNNPPTSGHRSDNQQPTANQPTNLPPTSQLPTPMIPGERNPSSENRSSDGPAGCAEHLNPPPTEGWHGCGRLRR